MTIFALDETAGSGYHAVHYGQGGPLSMIRIKFAFAFFLVVCLATWMVARTSKTAGAAEAAAPVVENYGENTEDVAKHRWQTNAPRHWRSLMVKH